MQRRAVLCYITDRSAFSVDERARRKSLIERIGTAARLGVDLVQLREKDLSGRELEELAGAALLAIRKNTKLGTCMTRLLINGRPDVALAAGAAGVHLPAESLSPTEAREVWLRAGRTDPRVISVACHNVNEVCAAAEERADFAIFAPVFEKKDAPQVKAVGLQALGGASKSSIPVLALGGITLANAPQCLDAGAAGIAAIRLFQHGDLGETVRALRRITGAASH